MMNVYFSQPNSTAKKSVAQLPIDFKLSDLKKTFQSLFPVSVYGELENYRLIVDGVDLNVQNETEFNKSKHHLKSGSIIYPLQRCRGGSDVDKITIQQIIRSQIRSELEKIPKVQATCIGDGSTEQCITLCCYKYCSDCFIQSFEEAKFKLQCRDCRKIIRYEEFFKIQDFIQTLNCLQQIDTFPKYIDYSVCKCGSPMVNETMYAKQHCIQCKRWFCFFCNEDWQEGTMKNQQYTCKKNCRYEMLITQGLVPLKFNRELQVPNKRICPNCFKDGGYGDGCKYNECPHCKHWFCYMCLKPQEECKKTSSHSTKCSEVVTQTYEIFPRLIKP